MNPNIGGREVRALCRRSIALILLLCGGYSASAAVTDFVSFDVPGAAFTRPWDINNNGVIVGLFKDGGGGVHGFVRNGATFTGVDYPGAGQTALLGINDAGDVVGRFVTAGVEHGFVRSGGQFQQIDFPGAFDTQCHGINAAGQVVGRYLKYKNDGQGGGSGRTEEHGFLAIRDQNQWIYTSVDYPDSTTTDAWKVTDAGEVIGDWSNQTGAVRNGSVYGYSLSGSQFAMQAFPGGVSTGSRKVNSSGQLVGLYSDKRGTEHGFLLVGEQYLGFDVPNAAWTDGNALNDLGAIVGSYGDAAGVEHGFVATIDGN